MYTSFSQVIGKVDLQTGKSFNCLGSPDSQGPRKAPGSLVQ